jgi:methionine biosynthesis protein MetW
MDEPAEPPALDPRAPITDGGVGLRAGGAASTPIDPLRYGRYEFRTFEVPGLIAGLVPRGARVLDVGCGSGTLAAMLVELRGATVVGIEPQPERAAAARGRGLHVVQSELNAEIAAGLGEFDVVVFADVLEHLVDPSAALGLARGLLTSGGSVIASVPNVGHWTVRRNLLCGRFDYTDTGIMDATHLRWFTRESLLRLFAGGGFSVTGVSASAGTWLPEYQAWPWRWLGTRIRRRLIPGLARSWPTLFGAQHVVRAVPER